MSQARVITRPEQLMRSTWVCFFSSMPTSLPVLSCRICLMALFRRLSDPRMPWRTFRCWKRPWEFLSVIWASCKRLLVTSLSRSSLKMSRNFSKMSMILRAFIAELTEKFVRTFLALNTRNYQIYVPKKPEGL